MIAKQETPKTKPFGDISMLHSERRDIKILYVPMNNDIGRNELIPTVSKLFVKTLKEVYPEAKYSMPSETDSYKCEGGMLENGINVSTPESKTGYVIEFYRVTKDGKPTDLAIEMTMSLGDRLDPKLYEAVDATQHKLIALSDIGKFKALAMGLKTFDPLADSIRT